MVRYLSCAQGLAVDPFGLDSTVQVLYTHALAPTHARARARAHALARALAPTHARARARARAASVRML